ncbi:MAG: response regulator [Chloroflexota bacterium]
MASERILFVDDEEQIRRLLTSFLGRRGYQVTTAEDGAQALRLLEQQEAPNLIITDVNMPNVDGVELTRRLRADARFADLPIIMLSAKAQTAEILAGYAEGADEYVPKPIEMAVLAAKVESLLRRAHPSATPTVIVQHVAAPPKRCQVIAIIHAKGGVGSSTLAAQAASALASTEQARVTLIDADVYAPTASALLGINPETTLAELAEFPVEAIGDSAFAQVASPHPSGLRVIVAGQRADIADGITPSTLNHTLERIRRTSDYIFIDTAAGLNPLNRAAIQAADLVCVVTAPRSLALNATGPLLDTLDRLQVPASKIRLILNRPWSKGLKDERVSAWLGRAPDLLVPHLPSFVDVSTKPAAPALKSGDVAAIVARDLATRIISFTDEGEITQAAA